VGAGVDDLLGETEVVVERVELLAGRRQVAGVAERDLGDRSLLVVSQGTSISG
jgi:hypothetical protein